MPADLESAPFDRSGIPSYYITWEIDIKNFGIVNFKNRTLLVLSDGHSGLVTPDPIPNSEVKLSVFVPVLSLMGKYKAVYFIFDKIYKYGN